MNLQNKDLVNINFGSPFQTINFSSFIMIVQDPYREYPWRILGYTNSLARPWRDMMPKQFYQLSLGVMHTYFLTNAYDYANRIDSTSWVSSFADCLTWHFLASWAVPALVVDNTVKLMQRSTNSRILPGLAAYALIPVVGVAMDRATNWYFYGFWAAGDKAKPRLRL